jgi:hypothetical protein
VSVRALCRTRLIELQVKRRFVGNPMTTSSVSILDRLSDHSAATARERWRYELHLLKDAKCDCSWQFWSRPARYDAIFGSRKYSMFIFQTLVCASRNFDLDTIQTRVCRHLSSKRWYQSAIVCSVYLELVMQLLAEKLMFSACLAIWAPLVVDKKQIELQRIELSIIV